MSHPDENLIVGNESNMDREDVEQKIYELVHQYRETHCREVLEAAYRLAYQLVKMKKE